MKPDVFFLAHGSPMNAMAQNSFTQMLNQLGRDPQLRPVATLVISPHWFTSGTRLTSNQELETIHDFGGFPDELFRIDYPAKGHPALAQAISSEYADVQLDTSWGLDHGAWSILRHIWPHAQIPIMQLSIDRALNWEEHYALAQKLRKWRNKNILFICSGNVIHNLRLISWNENEGPDEWAVEFQDKLKEILLLQNRETLLSRLAQIKNFSKAQPSDDHFIPLIYFLGLLENNEEIQVIFEAFQNRNISMLSLRSKD